MNQASIVNSIWICMSQNINFFSALCWWWVVVMIAFGVISSLLISTSSSANQLLLGVGIGNTSNKKSLKTSWPFGLEELTDITKSQRQTHTVCLSSSESMLTRVLSEEEKQTALCSAYGHIVKLILSMMVFY